MKTFSFTLSALTLVFGLSCASSRDSSSNIGLEKDSLPTPRSNVANAGDNSPIVSYNSSSTPLDESFWTIAAEGGIAEVEMGKIAVKKAQNPEVKKFAQMMIVDHTKANNQLKNAAATKKIVLPNTFGPNQKTTVDELNRLTGTDFDREYVQAMVDTHETDIQLFEDQADDDSDPEAQAFAAKTLPVLRKHLEAIKAIQARMQ